MHETITADTITNAQIRALRTEAEAAGDARQVDLCDLALAAHETADSQGGDLRGPDGEIWTRTEARDACADAINAARATGDVSLDEHGEASAARTAALVRLIRRHGAQAVIDAALRARRR